MLVPSVTTSVWAPPAQTIPEDAVKKLTALQNTTGLLGGLMFVKDVIGASIWKRPRGYPRGGRGANEIGAVRMTRDRRRRRCAASGRATPTPAMSDDWSKSGAWWWPRPRVGMSAGDGGDLCDISGPPGTKMSLTSPKRSGCSREPVPMAAGKLWPGP